MKTLLAVLIILTSFQTMAATAPCKIEAQTAAARLYSMENPGIGFFLRAKFKPVTDDKKIYHMVEIVEVDGFKTSQLTVTLNTNTCAVLSID